MRRAREKRVTIKEKMIRGRRPINKSVCDRRMGTVDYGTLTDAIDEEHGDECGGNANERNDPRTWKVEINVIDSEY